MAECDEDEEGIKKKDKEKHRESKNRPTSICPHSTETRQDSGAPRTRTCTQVRADHAAHRRLRTHGGHSGRGRVPWQRGWDVKGGTGRCGSGAQAGPPMLHAHPPWLGQTQRAGLRSQGPPSPQTQEAHEPPESCHLEEAPRCCTAWAPAGRKAVKTSPCSETVSCDLVASSLQRRGKSRAGR